MWLEVLGETHNSSPKTKTRTITTMSHCRHYLHANWLWAILLMSPCIHHHPHKNIHHVSNLYHCPFCPRRTSNLPTGKIERELQEHCSTGFATRPMPQASRSRWIRTTSSSTRVWSGPESSSSSWWA
jgi:hypothetical protein